MSLESSIRDYVTDAIETRMRQEGIMSMFGVDSDEEFITEEINAMSNMEIIKLISAYIAFTKTHGL